MPQLDIKLEGLEELRKVLHGVHEDVQKAERALMQRAVVMLRDEARQRIHTQTGRAARGIRYDIYPSSFEIVGKVRSRSVPAVFSQKSRSAERRMPPPKRIFKWLALRGQSPTKAMAFLVARAIGRHGTTGKPVMRDALEAKRFAIAAQFKEMIERAVRNRTHGHGG